jgi:formylglycine-generating enzyme required for sulfatase activity
MQGNVWEWCSSLWRPYVYRAADGRESPTQPGLRVLRGGGFADSAALLDPALRHAERPDRRFRWNGLRLARSAPIRPERPPTAPQGATQAK